MIPIQSTSPGQAIGRRFDERRASRPTMARNRNGGIRSWVRSRRPRRPAGPARRLIRHASSPCPGAVDLDRLLADAERRADLPVQQARHDQGEHLGLPRGLRCPRGRRRLPRATHSITRSARCRSDGGIVRPSALAILRLMTSPNLVGCSMGRSPGFVPLRILSTHPEPLRAGRSALAEST
jgi:hypothetical protein